MMRIFFAGAGASGKDSDNADHEDLGTKCADAAIRLSLKNSLRLTGNDIDFTTLICDSASFSVADRNSQRQAPACAGESDPLERLHELTRFYQSLLH